MPEPRRINFPVLRDPWSGAECLILHMKPIRDARPGVSPSQCYVVGMDPAGRFWRFGVPLVDYQRAAAAPRHFVEVDTLRAPSGTIVDPVGQPFTSPEVGERKAS